MKWTIKTIQYRTSGLIEAETEDEARKVFLKEVSQRDEYTNEDIIYCRPSGKLATHPALYDKDEIKKYGEKKYQEYKDSLSKDDKEYLENKFGKMK